MYNKWKLITTDRKYITCGRSSKLGFASIFIPTFTCKKMQEGVSGT